MKTIFISATMRNSGQSLVCWLLAQKLIERGMKVGLYRPMGVAGSGGEDPLVNLMFDLFEGRLVGSRECPVLIDPEGGLDPDLVEFHLAKIEKGFEELKGQCDICLAVGSRDVFFDTEQSSLPDTRFIEMFDATVILIDRFLTQAMTVFSALSLSSFLRGRLAGIITNRVPLDRYGKFASQTAPYLREKGAPILAVLPEDLVIQSPTLQDIAEILEADVLCKPEKLNRLAVGKTISAQALPTTMRIYKRVVNKILLQGGSVESVTHGGREVCGVVITGGRAPAQAVVDAAEKEGMPVLLTGKDTYAAIETIEKEKIHIKPRDAFRIERLVKLLADQADADRILKACGV